MRAYHGPGATHRILTNLRIAGIMSSSISEATEALTGTLLPRIMPDNAGLVTIWNDNQQLYITVYRSVFGRLAPNSIEHVEHAIAPIKGGQGTTVRSITSQVLDVVITACQETGGS